MVVLKTSLVNWLPWSVSVAHTWLTRLISSPLSKYG